MAGLPPPIDIPRVLEDLAFMLGEVSMECGHATRTPLNVSQLAARLDVSRGALRNWMDGSDPGLDHGLMLISLWCKVTGKAETFIHRQRPALSSALVR